MSTSSAPDGPTASPAARIASPRVLAIAWLVLTLLAAASRLWDLETRGMSHDEAQHGFYSHRLADQGVYVHDPKLHGPLLFHLTAAAFLLLGDTDATARLSVALSGVLLVVLLRPFRRWLGEGGALAAGALVLCSPSLLFYSRYIRNDVYIAVLLLVWVYALLRHLEERRGRWLLLMSAAMVISFCSKEVSFIHGAILGTFALALALRGRGTAEGGAAGDLAVTMATLVLPFAAGGVHFALGLPVMPTDDAAVRQGLVTLAVLTLVAIVLAWAWFGGGRGGSAPLGGPGFRTWARCATLFWGVAILLFSGLLARTAEGAVSGFVGSLGYWLQQHGVGRGSQPWFYYLILALLYEPVSLLLGAVVIGWVFRWRRRELAPATWPGSADTPSAAPPARRIFFDLLAWWAVAAVAAYALAGEKMPWLLVHVVLPLVLLAGWALGRIAGALAAAPTALATGGGLFLVGALTPVLLAGWSGVRPFAGRDHAAVAASARWLFLSALVVALAAIAARLGRRAGRRLAVRWLVAGACAMGSLWTARAALLASYVNFDLAVEPLVYAHATPDVKLAMREIELLSRRTAGERLLSVAYDPDAAWPFAWYLRNYPNARLVTEAAAIAAATPGVVLVAAPSDGKLWEAVARNYVPRVYRLIWWPLREYGGPDAVLPDPPPDLTWQQLRDVVLYRRYRAHTLAQWPYRKEVRMYVRRELTPLGGELPFTLAGLPPALAPSRRVPSPPLGGELLRIGGRPLDGPTVIAARPGGGWAIGEAAGRRVVVVDAAGAVRLERTAAHGLGEVWGVAFTAGGALAVADTWSGRVRIFDGAGRTLASRGEFGAATGNLERLRMFGPRALAGAPTGELVVADTGNRRLLWLDPGEGLRTVAASPDELGLSEPVGLARAPDGSLLVADAWNQRIVRLGPRLEVLAQWRVPGWQSRSAEHKPYLAVDAGGRIFASDPAAGRVLVYSPDGQLLAALRLPPLAGDAGLPRPLGVAIEPGTGRLAVVDGAGDRIYVGPVPALGEAEDSPPP